MIRALCSNVNKNKRLLLVSAIGGPIKFINDRLHAEMFSLFYHLNFRQLCQCQRKPK